MTTASQSLTNSNKIKFGLTAKFFILVLVSFCITIGFIIFQVGAQAERVAVSTIDSSLKKLEEALDTRLDSRYKSIEETARNLSRDGRLLPLIYEEVTSSLQEQCEEFNQSLDFDVLIFTNDRGDILARSDEPDAVGSSVSDSQLFQMALNGGASRGIMKRGEELLQLVAVPVLDNVATDIVRGTIAIGYSLTSSLANEIKSLTGSEIAFYVFQPGGTDKMHVVPMEICNTFLNAKSSLVSYFKRDSSLWDPVIEQKKISEGKFKIDDEIFHALLRPLATHDGFPIGFVVAFRSETELLRPFEIIKNRILVVGISCLFVTAGISYIIARRISTPIIKLVSVTKLIEDGVYPVQKPNVRTDEVGILHSAIYNMGQALKEKAELENYLSGLSESVDAYDVTRATAGIQFSTSMTGNDDVSSVTEHFHEGLELLDRYQIVKLLGKGAMGLVYQAKDLQLGELIALKVLFNRNLSTLQLNMFRQEIKLARKITHRNILRTYDFGTFDGMHFISMEYVQGFDLHQLIKSKGQIDLNMGIILARQMCSAISAAHNEGIIHRDLKPQNMLITKQGILKVMDFGIALNIGNKDPGKTTVVKDRIALATKFAGSPNFMAPEQFLGKNLDLRTDIYSLGVILFFIFSGDLPFHANSLLEISNKHLKTPPPKLNVTRPDAPVALGELIDKALAKAPEDRFSSITELSAELAYICT